MKIKTIISSLILLIGLCAMPTEASEKKQSQGTFDIGKFLKQPAPGYIQSGYESIGKPKTPATTTKTTTTKAPAATPSKAPATTTKTPAKTPAKTTSKEVVPAQQGWGDYLWSFVSPEPEPKKTTKEVATTKETKESKKVEAPEKEEETSDIEEGWEKVSKNVKMPKSMEKKIEIAQAPWYRKVFEAVKESEPVQEAKEYLVQQAREKGPELLKGALSIGAVTAVGLGAAATNKIKNLLETPTTPAATTPAETIPSTTTSAEITPSTTTPAETKKETAVTDQYKQAFYAKEFAQITSAQNSINEGNIEKAINTIREQQASWENIPDVTKEEPEFQQLIENSNALKQQLVQAVSTGIITLIQKIEDNSLDDIEVKNNAAQNSFEQAQNIEDAQKAIAIVTRNSVSIENTAQLLDKLGKDIKAIESLIPDNADFNALVTKLNTTIKTIYEPAAAQQLLTKTKKLATTLKNRVSAVQQQEANAEKNEEIGGEINSEINKEASNSR